LEVKKEAQEETKKYIN